MANREKLEALKKLLPLLKKEEGDVINRQLAKEVAGVGTQLDNPTLAEQLKSIQLPEEKVIKLPEVTAPSGSHLGDVIPEHKIQQHDLNLGEIIPEPKEPSRGMIEKSRVSPYLGEEIPLELNKQQLHLDSINLDSNLGETIPIDVSAPIEKLSSKWDFLKNNKGKLAAGAGLVGLAAMSGRNGETQALKRGASTEAPNTMAPSEVDVPETEEEKVIKKEIQKLSVPSAVERQVASDQPTVIDFGNNQSIASLERLQQIQDRANLLNTLAGFRDSSVTSYDIAGIPRPAGANFGSEGNAFRQQANNLISQYKDQVQFEKEDPNSAQSQGYRQLAKSMGFEIKGNASAADLERQLPQLANIYNQKNAQRERRESAAESRAARLQEMQMRLAGTQDAKKEKQKIKALDDYSKTADKEYLSLKKLENAVANMDYNNFQKGGPEDVAALYSFIRALDPESVVREGEIALARAGMSWPQQLKAAVLNRSQGGMMDPSYRKQMFTIAKHMAERGTAQYNELLMGKRERLKKSFGASDEEIEMVDPYLFRQKTREASKAPAASKETMDLINSRSEEENRKRLQELEQKYKK